LLREHKNFVNHFEAYVFNRLQKNPDEMIKRVPEIYQLYVENSNLMKLLPRQSVEEVEGESEEPEKKFDIFSNTPPKPVSNVQIDDMLKHEKEYLILEDDYMKSMDVKRIELEIFEKVVPSNMISETFRFLFQKEPPSDDIKFERLDLYALKSAISPYGVLNLLIKFAAKTSSSYALGLLTKANFGYALSSSFFLFSLEILNKWTGGKYFLLDAIHKWSGFLTIATQSAALIIVSGVTISTAVYISVAIIFLIGNAALSMWLQSYVDWLIKKTVTLTWNVMMSVPGVSHLINWWFTKELTDTMFQEDTGTQELAVDIFRIFFNFRTGQTPEKYIVKPLVTTVKPVIEHGLNIVKITIEQFYGKSVLAFMHYFTTNTFNTLENGNGEVKYVSVAYDIYNNLNEEQRGNFPKTIDKIIGRYKFIIDGIKPKRFNILPTVKKSMISLNMVGERDPKENFVDVMNSLGNISEIEYDQPINFLEKLNNVINLQNYNPFGKEFIYSDFETLIPANIWDYWLYMEFLKVNNEPRFKSSEINSDYNIIGSFIQIIKENSEKIIESLS
jgi:hypothetical protein